MEETKSCKWCFKYNPISNMIYVIMDNETKALWFCDWKCLARFAEGEEEE